MPVGIKTVWSARTPVQSRQRGSGTGALLAVCLGFFVIQLDVTIVNVALPAIQRGIGGSVAGLQWIVDAYTLALAAILLTAGATADRLGARRIFLLGLAVFAVGSAGSAIAPDHSSRPGSPAAPSGSRCWAPVRRGGPARGLARADVGRCGRVRGRDRAGLVCDQPSAAEQELADVRCTACDEAAAALVDNGGRHARRQQLWGACCGQSADDHGPGVLRSRRAAR